MMSIIIIIIIIISIIVNIISVISFINRAVIDLDLILNKVLDIGYKLP